MVRCGVTAVEDELSFKNPLKLYAMGRVMRDLVAGVLGMLAGAAGIVAIILGFWLVLASYGQVDRRDPNSLWSIIYRQHKRLGIAVATVFVVFVTAGILSAMVAKYLR